jgi:hypothetical protein
MIYADILADQSGILKGKGLKGVVEEILNNSDPRNNSSRVAIVKEFREGTEGSKHLLGADPDTPFEMVINVIGVRPNDQ